MTRRRVSTTSSPTADDDETCGVETPASTAEPRRTRTTSAPATAPTSWASQYAGTSRGGKRRFIANAVVTTGLKCAPDTSPIA